MKLLLLLLTFACVFLASCKEKSLTEKLKHIVEIKEKGDEKFEYFKIDSFRYSIGGLHGYYTAIVDIESDLIKNYIDILNNARHLRHNSLIVELSHSIEFATAKKRFLLNLVTDTAQNSTQVYDIDYFLDYQTERDNFKGHQTAHLYVSDLTPVRIDTDSLYKHSSAYKEYKYDTTAEINILNENDSLELQAKNLEREMDLRIAGGTNYGTILNYKQRIAIIRQKIANNRVAYYWLFVY